ncbi:MAG: hypothetical protein MUP41_07990 [Desulfobacterales bacterium]|nr:hypothetical protein [Desulfobacterales bacterium]
MILQSIYFGFIKDAGFLRGIASFLPLAFNIVQKAIERTHDQGMVNLCRGPLVKGEDMVLYQALA